MANAAVLSGKLAAHGEPYTTFCYIAKLLKVLIPLQGTGTLYTAACLECQLTITPYSSSIIEYTVLCS